MMRLKLSCNPHESYKSLGTQNPAPRGVPVRFRPRAPWIFSYTHYSNRRILGAWVGALQSWLPLIMLSAALTACGGGGGGGSPVPSLQAAPVAQAAPVVTLAPVVKPEPVCTPVQTVKIQLFGDSTGGGALAALQDAMNIRFGSGAVQIEARAVSGSTAWQLLSGTDGLNLPWPKSVNADIIVINHGINDLYQNESDDDYSYILGQLSVAPAIVVFETPLLAKSGRPDFSNTMRKVAKQKNIPLIDANTFQKNTPDWFVKYIIDDIHPNPAGFALLADAVMYPVLMPIVAKLKCL